MSSSSSSSTAPQVSLGLYMRASDGKILPVPTALLQRSPTLQFMKQHPDLFSYVKWTDSHEQPRHPSRQEPSQQLRAGNDETSTHSDAEEKLEILPLSHASSTALGLIVDWAEHPEHYAAPSAHLDTLPNHAIMAMLRVAHYLDLVDLQQRLSFYVAMKLEGKTTKQMREILCLPDETCDSKRVIDCQTIVTSQQQKSRRIAIVEKEDKEEEGEELPSRSLSMLDLPQECQLAILLFLTSNLRDVASVAQVCRKLFGLVEEDRFWCHVFAQQAGIPAGTPQHHWRPALWSSNSWKQSTQLLVEQTLRIEHAEFRYINREAHRKGQGVVMGEIETLTTRYRIKDCDIWQLAWQAMEVRNQPPMRSDVWFASFADLVFSDNDTSEVWKPLRLIHSRDREDDTKGRLDVPWWWWHDVIPERMVRLLLVTPGAEITSAGIPRCLHALWHQQQQPEAMESFVPWYTEGQLEHVPSCSCNL